MRTDLTRIAVWHVGLLAVGGALAFLLGIGEPASLVLGGAVMAANLWLMRVMTDGLLRRGGTEDGGRRVGFAVGAMVLKFGLFLGLVIAMFSRLPIEGLSFAVGVTLLLAACVVEAGRGGAVSVKGES